MVEPGREDAPVCPRCGGQLLAGYLQSPRYLTWSAEPATWWYAGGERLTGLMTPGSLPGHRCPRCREITVTYPD